MEDTETLLSLLNSSGIDIPENRKKDLHWLSRNFSIRNKNHPLHDEIIKTIKKILLNKK